MKIGNLTWSSEMSNVPDTADKEKELAELALFFAEKLKELAFTKQALLRQKALSAAKASIDAEGKVTLKD